MELSRSSEVFESESEMGFRIVSASLASKETNAGNF